MKKFALLLLGLIVGAADLLQNVQAQIPESRIVSGYQAYLGQLPWQVLIREDEFNDLLCGGSIISPDWVLTAAHCCDNKDSLLLQFGTITLDNYDALNMTATQLYIHPNYDSKTYNNDVCLVKLPQSLQFSRIIAPISLIPTAQTGISFVNSVGVIAGFGVMNDEYMDASENLLWAQIKIIENSICADVYKDGLIIDSTMCGVGYGVANMSICTGDSGGPMITIDQNGNWIQIGINSFVPVDSCTNGLPSAYARVASFLTYIYNVTGLPQI